MPNILIIEDEKLARDYLKKLIRQSYPEIVTIATAEDAETAKKRMAETAPDIVFLDIELPGKNGFTFLEECQPVQFQVIFTTAFTDYATRAFEYFALGYMVKPLEPRLLKKNMDKAIQRLDSQKMNEKIEMMLNMVRTRDEHRKTLPLPTQYGFELVQTEQVVYCRSEGNYTTFYLKDKRSIVVSKQLGVYEKLLPVQEFVRIHSQYIVNVSYVIKYAKGSGGNVTLSTGEDLPVSANRKQEFLERFML